MRVARAQLGIQPDLREQLAHLASTFLRWPCRAEQRLGQRLRDREARVEAGVRILKNQLQLAR